jgi:hypothetical protein
MGRSTVMVCVSSSFELALRAACSTIDPSKHDTPVTVTTVERNPESRVFWRANLKKYHALMQAAARGRRMNPYARVDVPDCRHAESRRS